MQTRKLCWITFLQSIAVGLAFVSLRSNAFSPLKPERRFQPLQLRRLCGQEWQPLRLGAGMNCMGFVKLLPSGSRTRMFARVNAARGTGKPKPKHNNKRKNEEKAVQMGRGKAEEEDVNDYDNMFAGYDVGDHEYDGAIEAEEEDDMSMDWTSFNDFNHERSEMDYDEEEEEEEDEEAEEENQQDDELRYLNSSIAARWTNSSVMLGGEGKLAEFLPSIAVVGRPNVGKSTVVNRLAGKHREGSIVFNEPGVTRDRSYHVGQYNGYYFQIVDTGGILFNDQAGEIFARHIREQADLAVEHCSVVLFVADVRDGITELDKQIARYLKSKGKPVVIVVNKAEGRWGEAEKFVRLGLGRPFPISGVHGVGMADVLDELTQKHLEQVSVLIPDDDINVAVVGRPNVGKSSLFNRLYGQNRSIVSDVAGTTRDTIDATIAYNNKRYKVVDTAGVRKKSKIPKGTEYLMVNRALKALARSDVSLLIIDAPEGITEQDRVLAKRIAQDGRACVIVLNKWDAIPEKDEKMHDQGIKYVHEQLPDLAWAEVLMVSAVTGQRCTKIFEAIDKAQESHNRRYSTSVINTVLKDALLWEPPPAVASGGATGRIYYATQVATAPPAIAMFCNNPRRVPDSYKRYLERRFREALKFEGTPLKFRWRARTARSAERISRHKLRPV